MSNIKPIETFYAGYKFRSRLEARWAVFFDAIGMEYRYEPEGFEFDDGARYLPDFWLPQLNIWAEIKPVTPLDQEKKLMHQLTQGTGHNGIILAGTPQRPLIDYLNQTLLSSYDVFMFMSTPEPPLMGLAKSIYRHWIDIMPEFLESKGYSPMPVDGEFTKDHLENWLSLDRDYYFKEYGVEHPKWKYGYVEKGLIWANEVGNEYCELDTALVHASFIEADYPIMHYAYNLAQTAQFEYGQTPKVKSWWADDSIPF